MPTINDATVVAQAYDTSGNGGRKLVRLANGRLVAVLKTGSGFYIYKSTDNGATWTKLVTESNNIGDVAMVAIGNNIGLLRGAGSTSINFSVVDVVNDKLVGGVSVVDSGQSAIGNVSLAIDDTGTELHAAWASKNSGYPNSFNIRYAKGTINADGSVKWSSIEQITAENNGAFHLRNPSIALGKDNVPFIVVESENVAYMNDNTALSSNSVILLKRDKILPYSANVHLNWSAKTIYNGSSYQQVSPSAIFVPKSINGLVNGRIWVVWHGTDSTDSTVYNLKVAYSDDNGITWSAAQKLTNGNTFAHNYASITANKYNEVFVVWQGTSSNIREVKFIKWSNNAWGSVITKTNVGNNLDRYPSALYDPNFKFIEPLFIYMGVSKVGIFGNWSIISAAEGEIGTKSNRNSLLTYSITSDSMSTITEKINGTVVNTRSNPVSGQSFTVSLSQAQWDAIKYGKYKDASGGLNTLTIEMGSDSWVYTFDKRLASSDDVLSAVKAVQDSQNTFLPSVKAKLASAIRGKGGTVNDADSWGTMKTAIDGIQLGVVGGKKFASGTATANGGKLLSVSGLTFTPSVVIAYRNSSDNSDTSFINTRVKISSTSYNHLDYTATVSMTGFTMGVDTANGVYNWVAYE
ncbi:sialidase family protein [Fictibacillus sp. Mic-4]|uniref:sialidase family protein n=1 Tax=Fictibacillus sp. Mic-4 TaxID=3132826 RepID=UPI003CE75866